MSQVLLCVHKWLIVEMYGKGAWNRCSRCNESWFVGKGDPEPRVVLGRIDND